MSSRPIGVLRVSYFVNCGDCGMQSNHLPDPRITSWETLMKTLTGGMWPWTHTADRGWICGCTSRGQARKVTASKKKTIDDDLPF